jgi:hypothetical protein
MRGLHIAAGPRSPDAGAPRRTRPLAQLSARARAPRLDRELQAGVAAWSSPAHAARALQLTSDRHRRGLARSLERLARRLQPPALRTPGAVDAPDRELSGATGPLMRAIAARLRDGSPVGARGMASLGALLADDRKLSNARGDPTKLTAALESVSKWLNVLD